ncbi:hypothetical protein PPERSA_02101 [Pseudocohnilembus persalinus]|uniref:Uncharacterized protein n=1 Tax=Pseudocohnilembus persalinus TaxID=266149 RepID=A0A0V0Q8F0_PSEPJ|nr:hypothetical protein PPERSA_02101 [Pseudocohnilembus persalinus]|eukprot:KRW98324.1 hypothetical protein PPERSA_02101 [Pseudocohnilembus persalinus]
MKPPSREKGLNLARPKAISRPSNKKLELTKDQLQKQQEILQDKQQKQIQKIMNEKEQILQIQQALNQQINDSSKQNLEKNNEKNNQFQDLDWKKKYLYLMKKSKDKNQDNNDQQSEKDFQNQKENLQKLYITNNNIKSLSGLENCKQLDTICAFNNKITDFNSLLFVLGDLNLLKNLDLEENPVLTESSYSAQQIVQICQNIESLNGKKIQNQFKEQQQQLNQSQMFKTNQSSMMSRTILFQNNGKPNQDKPSSINNNSTFFNKTFLSGSFDFNENKEDLLQYIEELKEDKEELLQNYEDLIKDLKDAEQNAYKYEQFHKEQLEENIILKVENEQLQNQIKLLQAQIYQNDKNNNITKNEKELKQEIMYLKQEIQNLQEENMDLKINGVLQGVDSDSDQDEEFQQQQIKNIQKRSQQIIKHNQAILGQNKEYNEINDNEIRKSQLNFYKNMTQNNNQNNNQIENLNRDQNYNLNKQQVDLSFDEEQKNDIVNADDDMDSDIMDIMNRNNQGLEELQKTLSDLKKGNIY